METKKHPHKHIKPYNEFYELGLEGNKFSIWVCRKLKVKPYLDPLFKAKGDVVKLVK